MTLLSWVAGCAPITNFECENDDECASFGPNWVCAKDQGWCEQKDLQYAEPASPAPPGPYTSSFDSTPPVDSTPEPSVLPDVPLGALIITELMFANSAPVWFELYNASGAEIVPKGLQVGTLADPNKRFVLTGEVGIAPGEYYVVASEPFTKEKAYTDEIWVDFANDVDGWNQIDSLYVQGGQGLIAVMVWGGANWNPGNSTMQLNAAELSTLSPGDAANLENWTMWECGERFRYDGIHCGTPGETNQR